LLSLSQRTHTKQQRKELQRHIQSLLTIRTDPENYCDVEILNTYTNLTTQQRVQGQIRAGNLGQALKMLFQDEIAEFTEEFMLS
jgi:hypothetical protein